MSAPTSTLVLGLLLACAAGTSCAAHDGHQHVATGAAGQIQRTWLTIPASKVSLVGTDGAEHRLADALANEGPIYLNFVYTSCTTVCPLMNQVFGELQFSIPRTGPAPQFMSISIDPEHDTPARLTEYANAVGAGPNWHFYTGTLAASEATQRLFGVYEADKMNHRVATLYRASKRARWLRIEGFLTPDQLLKETAKRKSTAQ